MDSSFIMGCAPSSYFRFIGFCCCWFCQSGKIQRKNRHTINQPTVSLLPFNRIKRSGIQTIYYTKRIQKRTHSLAHIDARYDIDHSHVSRSRDNEHFSRLNARNLPATILNIWYGVESVLFLYRADDCVEHWLDDGDFITNFVYAVLEQQRITKEKQKKT